MRPKGGSHLPDVRPEFLALGYLEEGPLHGYDLYRRFEAELGGIWHISQSQMYAVLKRLEAQGLVEASVEEAGPSPARRVLRTTKQGSARFQSWLEAPSDCNTRIMRLEFIARLYFARRQTPGKLPDIVEGQSSALARQRANHEALLASLPPTDTWTRLGLEFRIRQLSAIASWLEESVKQLL
jgi:DNA-binding PadR family transcriptional regulator